MGNMQLSVLCEAEIEKLHKQTLEVFEKVGIKVTHEEALRKLKRAGARVDESTQIARIPAKMFEELLSQAPSVAEGTGLNAKDLRFGGDNRYYSSLILDPFVNDYHDGVRVPKLEDVRRHTIIGESLDRVSILMRMQAPVSDVPEPDCYLKTMEVFLCHLSKHVTAMPTSAENCRQWFDVYEVIADAAGLDVAKAPLLTICMAVTSPLQIHGNNVDIMKMALTRSYPVLPTVCPMAGTTSPYSLAGTALLANVEALAAALLVQLYKPGHPVLYCTAPSTTNLKSGHDLYYKGEKMIWKTIHSQMGKFYKLPIAHECGGSLTYRPDMQNGAESLAYIMASVFCGQNRMGGLGSMGNANGMSAEQIIMQCGLVDMAEYLAGGVDMSDYKLAFDSIKEAGPGGNYLIDQLTLDLMRGTEFFESPYFDLTGGYVKGAAGMYELAHQKAEELVANYKPTVPEKIRTAIKNFFKDRYQDKKVADL